MKLLKGILTLGAVVFLFGAVFFFGPDVIHALYLAQTPTSLIKEQKDNYFRLENHEIGLHGQALAESQNERERICLWLSAQGVVDFDGEGSDTPPPICQPWADLANYWRGE
jgi:hypothetical protein